MFPKGMAAYYSLSLVRTHGIIFLVLYMYLVFFCLTAVLIWNSLDYVNV